MVTLASAIEPLDIDALDVEERLDLINALWDSVAAEPKAFAAEGVHAAELRRWLGAPAANCDPDGDELDDEILAGIVCRI